MRGRGIRILILFSTHPRSPVPTSRHQRPTLQSGPSAKPIVEVNISRGFWPPVKYESWRHHLLHTSHLHWRRRGVSNAFYSSNRYGRTPKLLCLFRCVLCILSFVSNVVSEASALIRKIR